MKRFHPILAFSLLGIAFGAMASNPNSLPATEVSIGELLRETTWQQVAPSGIQLVVWMPQEYWTSFVAQQGGAQGSEQILKALSNYALFAVVKGKPGGEDDYEDAESIRAAMRLVGASGTLHAPLAENLVAPELGALLGYMKPVLAQSMGALGKGMHFIVFKSRDDSGAAVADALAAGRLTVRLEDQQHVYRLPLGSLLRPMRDTRTSETFPGNYEFNPYTGEALQRVSPKGN